MITLLVSGCAANYQQNHLSQPSAKLMKDKSIVISTPLNGAYGNKSYSSSGVSTALATRAAFAKHTNNIKIIAGCSEITCLKSDPNVSYDYYVVPEILHWEDRSTEWSGIPDKLEIKISIYEGDNKNEFASSIISGKSKWMTLGGDHPQDLLPEPLNRYIESLY